MAGAVLVAVFGVPLLMLPLGGNPFGPPKLALLLWAATAILAACALQPRWRTALAELVRHSWVTRIALVLAALATLAAAASADPRAALLGSYPDYRGLLTLVACVVVGFGAAAWLRVQRSSAEEFLTRGASAAGILLAVMAIAERAGLPLLPAGLKLEGAIRVIASAGNASNLGVLLVMLLPLALAGALRDTVPAWRWVGRLSTVSMLLPLVWTLSRGAWIGAGVAVVVAFALSRDRRSLALLAAAGACVLALGVATMPQAVSRAGALLDTGSSTATWRFSTWESATSMIADRPLLGHGPAGFRTAYPEFKQPGQDDGRLGYVPTESPHNVVLEAGTSFGVGGVAAALALAVAVALIGARRLRDAKEEDRARAVAVLAALCAGFTALQLHYLTLDTGPLLAALLGVVAAWELAAVREPAPATAPVSRARPAIPLAAAYAAAAFVLLLAAITATALTAADARLGRAAAATRTGVGWTSVSARIDSALRLAPFEPALAQRAGRAAMQALDRGPSPGVVTDGRRWYAAALATSPHDPYLAVEVGEFLLRSSLLTSDPDLLLLAEEVLRAAAELDPASGMPLAAIARVELVRGDVAGAVRTLERSLKLSPENDAAREDLARAEREAGL